MMTYRIAIALVAAGMAFGTAVNAEEKQQETSEKAEVKAQTTCPVMGGKINKQEYVDVKGCRIYVCCAGCKAKIKADPDTYINKLKDEGVTPEKTPEKSEAKEDK